MAVSHAITVAEMWQHRMQVRWQTWELLPVQKPKNHDQIDSPGSLDSPGCGVFLDVAAALCCCVFFSG